MAAAAIIVEGSELNQQAVIATDDFPGIYWGKSRGHRVVGVPEPALLTEQPNLKKGRGFGCRLNLRYDACGCQG